ncbi:MAG: AAA family ATPase [Saprospiraceae bacterium]|nr:AAA family ATPase [Saprospiraceae bacterium]
MSPETLHNSWPDQHSVEELRKGPVQLPELIHRLKLALELIETHPNRIFTHDLEKVAFLRTEGRISPASSQLMIDLLSGRFNTIEDHQQFVEDYIYLLNELYSMSKSEQVTSDYKVNAFQIQKIPNHLNPNLLEENERGLILNMDESHLIFSLDRFPSEQNFLLLRTLRKGMVDIIKKSAAILQFPVPVYFHHLHKKEHGWVFEGLCIFPDFLVDVTSIAACYSPNKSSAIRHLIHLFQYAPASKHILIGNAVNEFLDELIIHPDAKFEPLLSHVFRKYPFAISLLGEAEVKDFVDQAQYQFDNLKALAESRFEGLLREEEACQLEPSFFSVIYGIQGRLDVLIESGTSYKIIELKSGRPYYENAYGINPAHEAQAQLYKLLINSAKDRSVKADCYLLYSTQKDRPIRHSPHNETLIQTLFDIRNSIVLIHLHLATTDPEVPGLLDLLKPNHFSDLDQFLKRDGYSFLQTYLDLDATERAYFKNYCHFIAREQLISKTGMSGPNSANGLADLWLKSSEEKENLYLILKGLKIEEIIFNDLDSPLVVLSLHKEYSGFSAFRNGDTLILYPEEINGHGALMNQVYKCTLVEIGFEVCKVRLRGRQFDKRAYPQHQSWCLEPDVLDRSFLHQYENLYEWASAPKSFRKKIMGIDPASEQESNWNHPILLPEDIKEVVSRAMSAKDYFLIWGPPGSGKTSMVIKALVENIVLHTGENLLLLAYTNRAVDEICEAIEKLGDDELYDFIRIGSRYGTAEKFHSKLLDYKLRAVENRREFRKMLRRHRIFTATVASMQGKKELFELLRFDIVIIDEASQILEPNLIGLLYQFKKFILIGDHKQLPAVSSQNKESTLIKNSDLLSLGISSTADSFFERMYKRCQAVGWLHSIGMLKRQGRMHQKIMDLPSELFYSGQLKLMTPSGRQTDLYSTNFPLTPAEKFKIIGTERCIFVPVESENTTNFAKVNYEEVNATCAIVHEIIDMYRKNKKSFSDQSLGIISPFRAHNAAIITEMHRLNLMETNYIKTDTVERYQGSARDIILFSCCANSREQLSQISQLDGDGVNRKLNVALSRAREQVIVIGNPNVLKFAPEFKILMERYSWLTI